MTRSLLRFFLVVTAFSGLLDGPAAAAEYLIDRDKVEITAGPEPKASFIVRLTEVGGIAKAEATVAGKPAAVEKTEVPGGKTQIYFLLDLSASDGVLKAEKEEFRQVIEGLPAAEFEVGLGTMGASFTHWFSALPEKVAREATLASLAGKKRENRTEIHRSTREALDKMKSAPGSAGLRKVLVLMTPAKTEEREGRALLDAITGDCVKEGILVCLVSYARTAPEVEAAEVLRHLARDTGGVAIETDPATNRLMRALVVELRAQLRSAARLTVNLKDAPPGPQELSVQLGLADARTLTLERKIEVPAAGAAPAKATPPAETPPAQTPPATPTPNMVAVHASPPWFWPAVGGGVLLLAVLAWWVMSLIRRPQPATALWQQKEPEAVPPWPPADYQPPISADIKTEVDGELPGRSIASTTEFLLGWLEEIDQAGVRGTRHPISKTTLTLGRSGDSDLQLLHESISVHHATLHRKSDGEIAIDDLQTLNGVYVNGKRIGHSTLKDGDIIELGAVRLRLVLNANGQAGLS